MHADGEKLPAYERIDFEKAKNLPAITITVTRLTPCVAARIAGGDLAQPPDEPTRAGIRAAFEAQSVLVLRGRPMDDDAQIVFSR